MGRCILVLCLPRSGSSALAGALHRMGVDMGEGHLQVADALNPKGYYEDLRWHAINKPLSGYGYEIREPVRMTPLIERRIYDVLEQVEGKPLWGIKSPRFAFTASHIVPHIERAGHEVRPIVTYRPIEQVIDSMHRHSQKAYNGTRRRTRRAVETTITRWKKALSKSIDEILPRAAIEVHYSDLTEAPEWTLRDVCSFVYSKIDSPLPDIAPAIEWINPEMRHFK